jgi:hypothetical protein
MAEELGKIEKPQAEDFKKGRKLFFVPLMLSAGEEDIELDLKIGKYWEQVEAQVNNLRSRLGDVSVIFHELIPSSGDEALKSISRLSRDSLKLIEGQIAGGAKIEPLEDADILFEYLDWGRCLSIGLQSQIVFNAVRESYAKSQKKRSEKMIENINAALKEDQSGIIIMVEGHQMQFPPDIQVFYISPPGLDDLKRWLRSREEEAERAAATAANSEPAQPDDEAQP